MTDTAMMKEKTILVAVALPGLRDETEHALDELENLTNTAGGQVVDRIIQPRKSIDNTQYIGEGKLELIEHVAEELDAKVILFDDELTPSQQKNIQKKLKDLKILDRSGLILDIFQRHAKTRESKTQVELAYLEYILPRLTRAWTHLERQAGGGVATRGMGETQIEIDRRLIRGKIQKLKAELKKISIQRETKRKFRGQHFNVALVGYTNAGKSTFMNQLTEADVEVEDKLFATLDTTVRTMNIDKSHQIYLSDTVGFIQKLPHQLVASFRSTLREAETADLLLKIIDISDPNFRTHLDTIDSVLDEFKIPSKRFMTVFNKTDLFPDSMNMSFIKKEFPDAFYISAARNLGMDKILKAIRNRMDEENRQHHIKVNAADGKAISALYKNVEILSEEYEDDYILYKITVDPAIYARLKKNFSFEEIKN